MAPWKCVDCGIWWSGPEHRCVPDVFRAPPQMPKHNFTDRCTCYIKGTGTVKITCPVHDTTVTYT